MNEPHRLATQHLRFWAVIVLLVAAWLRIHDLPSAPPGLHFDEAANAIITQNIAEAGYLPIFIPDFTGKEVLWFYWAALLTKVAGGSVFVLRYASVLIGVLTVAAAGWAVARLFPEHGQRKHLFLFTMAIISVALWHSILSRLAFRAITQPLLQALTIGLLWSAFTAPKQRQGFWYSVVAGMAFGLTGYTYLAARLFPIVIALALATWLVARGFDRISLVRIGCFSLAAIITFAPLGAFFLRNPEAFGTRIEQVGPASVAESLEGWRLAGRMLFLSGDPLWRFNVPLAPLFDPILAIFLVIGFVLILGAVGRRQQLPEQRARSVLMLVWPLVMLAPTALAVGSITPSNLRAIGLLPLIALYPALGITFVLKRLSRTNISSLHTMLVFLLVLLGGYTANQLTTWQNSPEVYYQNDGHVAVMAGALAQYGGNNSAYAATEHLDHPTLRYLSAPLAVQSIFEGQAAVFPTESQTMVAYARNALPPATWQAEWEQFLLEEQLGPDGTPDYVLYQFPDGYLPEMEIEVNADVSNLLTLRGATLYPTISGDIAEVDLLWEITGVADQPDYSFTAQICDVGGWCWLKANSNGTVERGVNASFPSDRWQVGDHLFLRLEIPTPVGLPPGEYTLQTSVFSASSGAALPVLIDAQVIGQVVRIEGLEVVRNQNPDIDSVPMQYMELTQITPSIKLLGWDLPVLEARQGEEINLALHWQAMSDQPPQEQVTIQLGDEVLVQRDPVYGTYPTDLWRASETVTDRYLLQIPIDADAGEQLLSLRLGDGEPIILEQINVREVVRQFELPSPVNMLEQPALYEQQITLAGFIDTAEELSVFAGEEVTIQPVWQTIDDISEDYIIFVHVLDANGQLVAQIDRTPLVAGEPYPTSLWVAGEVIVEDAYNLTLPADLPPGDYRIAAGLYRQDTGQRLLLDNGGDVFTLHIVLEVQ